MLVVLIFSLFLLAVGAFIVFYANTGLQEIKEDNVKSKYYNSSYFVFTRNEMSKVGTDAGMLGEYKTFNSLRDYEDVGGKFLFNVYLPREDSTTTEIDLLFLTPKGIFVIESKNYQGMVLGNANDLEWIQSFDNNIRIPFYNPIKQNETHIKYLKNQIGDVLPIYSVIVFSDDCNLKYVPNDVKNTFVVNRSMLSSLISTILVNSDQLVSHKTVDELQKMLFPFSQITEKEKMEHVRNVKERMDNYLSEAKETVEKRNLKDVLEHFRAFKAEIYNVAKNSVLDDQELDKLSTFRPKNMDELRNWNILPLSKLYAYGEEVLKTINEYVYTENNLAKKKI